MRPKTFYFMRHGQSEANIEGVINSILEPNSYDARLTDDGRQEVFRSAFELREQIHENSIKIFSSPFRRAKETAEIISGVLHQDFHIDERLKERSFGLLDGKSDDLYNTVWDNDLRGISNKNFNVEELSSVFERIVAFINDAKRVEVAESIICCTHGDVISIAFAGFSGKSLNVHRKIAEFGTGKFIKMPKGI